MRAKLSVGGFAVIAILIAFGLIGAVAWRVLTGPLGTDCYVNFNGTTFEEAKELQRVLAEDGLDAELSGQPGGPQRTPVVSVFDGGFFDNGESPRRLNLSAAVASRPASAAPSATSSRPKQLSPVTPRCSSTTIAK